MKKARRVEKQIIRLPGTNWSAPTARLCKRETPSAVIRMQSIAIERLEEASPFTAATIMSLYPPIIAISQFAHPAPDRHRGRRKAP